MGQDVLDGPAHALVETRGAAEARNDALELLVVEEHGPGLVAQQLPFQVVIRRHGVQEIGRDIIRLQLHAEHVGDDPVDLAPGQRLVRGDLEGVADGVGVAHQADESFGEIRIVRQRPLGRAVPVQDDGFAVQHAAEHLPGALGTVYGQRDAALVVGVAGTDDGDRIALRAEFLHQEILARDFVAGVLPVRVGERRALRDEGVDRRLLVGRGGADVHVLLRLAAEQAPVAFHLRRHEADEVADAVPLHAGQLGGCVRLVGDVRVDDLDAGGYGFPARAAVKERQLPFLARRERPRDGGADGAGAADEQCFPFHARASL